MRAASQDRPCGLRERKKARTRAAIREHALRLFREQGYQRTTVEQIAAAAEVSPSTFFRYFPTKEDLVLQDDMDTRMVEAFERQPAGLGAIAAIRGAIGEMLSSYDEADLDLILETTTLTMTVPEVRARAMDEFGRTIAVISEALAKRAGRPADDLAVRAVAGAIIGVIMSITMPWEGWSSDRQVIVDMFERIDQALGLLEDGLPLLRSSLLQRCVSGVAGRRPTVDGPGWTSTRGTVTRMRWLAALLFAGGLAAGLGAGLTGTAHASDPTRPGRPWNEISLLFGHGKGNTMCVDVPGGTTTPGAQLQLYHCHGYAPDGAPQRWQFLGGRFFGVWNPDSGLCIGFPGGGAPVSGARLVVESCDQAPAWRLVRQSRDSTDPLFVLETSGPGGPALCMTAGNLSDKNRTPLVAVPCQGFGTAAEFFELG